MHWVCTTILSSIVHPICPRTRIPASVHVHTWRLLSHSHSSHEISDYHLPRLIYFSFVITGGTTLAYLIDTHGASATHVIALNDFTKGMISYSMTFVANGIVVARGVKVSLLTLGACQAGCLLLVVPMYVYGKRVRSFVSGSP